MARRSATRIAGAVALLAGACLLTGCVANRGDDIQTAARAAFADAGLEAGAEAFARQPPGLGNRFDILTCAVVPTASEPDLDAAETVAAVLNAVRPVTVDFAAQLGQVQVRLVTGSVSEEELNDWCRTSWDDVVDFTEVGFELSEGEFLDFSVYGVDVPYDEVTVVDPQPAG